MKFSDIGSSRLNIALLLVVAFLAAFVLNYAISAWRIHGGFGNSARQYSDQEKLEILAGLKTDSNLSVEEKAAVLQELKTSSSANELSEEQKLEILKKLHATQP